MEDRYLFKSCSAASASGVHYIGPAFFKILKNGRALSRSRDKPAESSHATGKPSHILDALWCFNLLDGLDLVGIGFNSPLRHKEPEKLAGGDSKHALLGVQFEVDLAQIYKCFI